MNPFHGGVRTDPGPDRLGTSPEYSMSKEIKNKTNQPKQYIKRCGYSRRAEHSGERQPTDRSLYLSDVHQKRLIGRLNEFFSVVSYRTFNIVKRPKDLL
jgi:hypothetical protein